MLYPRTVTTTDMPLSSPQIPSYSLLHTEWSKGWGGQEIRILAESRAFRERGVNVIIATQPDATLYNKALEAGFTIAPVRMHKGLNFGAVAKLVKIIRENKIDIVHSHSSVDHRLAGIAARLTGRPIVRSRHLSTPIKRSPLSKALYTKLADKVITSGEFIRDAMIEHNGMPPNHIVSIPAGTDIDQFSLKRDLPNVRGNFGINESDFVVGIVGVLRSWKGHADLIHAAIRARQRIPHLKLLIVGEGPQRPAIEKMIDETLSSDFIHLTGHQADPAAFMKAMDIVTLPSYANEATSQVLPQAMAMFRPVISSNIGGLPEVVIHEKTGLLVPPHSPEKLANAIVYLYENPSLRNELAAQGHLHILKRFTFKGMIDNTQHVYEELLVGRRNLY